MNKRENKYTDKKQKERSDKYQRVVTVNEQLLYIGKLNNTVTFRLRAALHDKDSGHAKLGGKHYRQRKQLVLRLSGENVCKKNIERSV